MIRNLKGLGVAFVAMLAVGAAAASAAQAAPAHFTAEKGTTKITGTSEGTNNQVFTTAAGAIECHGSFTSENEPTTTEELTVKGSYGPCNKLFGIEPKVNMGGCHYTFHAGEYDSEKDASTGTADLVCNETEGNEFITISVGFACTVTVPPKNGLGPIHFENKEVEGRKIVTVNPTVNNIKYTSKGLFCPNVTKENGTYEGGVIVEGETNEEEPRDVSITST